ncbi:hypothetical protein FRC02_006518 [Tulasnella sp. 418]|nr:hypothetical protein FRC02_006518 [Tulasnella sp. 418]
MSSLTVPDAIEKLWTYRSRQVRASKEILELGLFLMDSGVDLHKKMDDEYWAFLEQIAFAAMDLGRVEIADDCITQLEERFPDSTRVQVLHGMRLECSGDKKDLLDALQMYDKTLQEDDANAGIWKRRVAVYKQLGDAKSAVEDLCRYLDTFYTDVEGWLELAALYTNNHEYATGLEALSHAMALSPQNPFYVLQFAETAATKGGRDGWALALKMYLRCVEMCEDGVELDELTGKRPGVCRRAWFGARLAIRRLVGSADKSGPDHMGVPNEETLKQLLQTANERLAEEYSGSGEKSSNKVVIEWIGA